MSPADALKLRALAELAARAPSEMQRRMAASILVVEVLRIIPEPRGPNLHVVKEHSNV